MIAAPVAALLLVFAKLSLAQAEESALPNAPDVLAAQARFEQSASSLAIARGVSAPAFSVNYVQTPQGNPPGPTITSQITTIGLQTNLIDILSAPPLVREAMFTLAATQADEHSAEMSERVHVIGLYYDALKAHAVAHARADALALTKAQKNATRTRILAGDAPELDAVRADTAVAQATADLQITQAADMNASEALRIEAGCADDALLETKPIVPTVINPLFADPQTAVSLARALRPEMQSAKHVIEAAQAQAQASRKAGLPAVTLGGGYAVGRDSGVGVSGPGLSAQMTIPLSSAARDRTALASAKVREAQAKAQGIERTVLLGVSQAARIVQAEQHAATSTERAAQSAQAELHAVEFGYRNGVLSSLELSSARAAYTQARINELTALYDLEKAAQTLKVEVGP
jgi:outer membrane protein TolC